MSKELKKITESVMGQIHEGKVSMRPKAYFITGSIVTFFGLVFSLVTSVFLVGVLRFSIRSHGPMKDIRFEEFLDSFSWWVPVLAFFCLGVGIWLLRQYDFSYKKNYTLIVMGVIIAVIFSGVIVDDLGFQDNLAKRGHMKGFLKEHKRLEGQGPFNRLEEMNR